MGAGKTRVRTTLRLLILSALCASSSANASPSPSPTAADVLAFERDHWDAFVRTGNVSAGTVPFEVRALRCRRQGGVSPGDYSCRYRLAYGAADAPADREWLSRGACQGRIPAVRAADGRWVLNVERMANTAIRLSQSCRDRGGNQGDRTPPVS